MHPSLLLQAALIPVPAQLFQGSLLLGGLVKAGLGQSALAGTNVLVHPLLVAGWCGMISTALNLLPVGRIDGGRMMQVNTPLNKACNHGCHELHCHQQMHRYGAAMGTGLWPCALDVMACIHTKNSALLCD